MSYHQNLIHAVWRTKSNTPFLKNPQKKIIIDHIKEYSQEKGIAVDTINGYLDHLHCLYDLPSDMTLRDSLRFLKGESSHWINKQKLFKVKFNWGSKYYAVSVSPQNRMKVRRYIRNQEEHHKKVTWNQEVDHFLKWYGLKDGSL